MEVIYVVVETTVFLSAVAQVPANSGKGSCLLLLLLLLRYVVRFPLAGVLLLLLLFFLRFSFFSFICFAALAADVFFKQQ